MSNWTCINTEEVWRDIEGYYGKYQISNIGNVRSVDFYVERKDGKTAFIKGRLLKQSICPKGYPRIKLSQGKTNQKTIRIHRIVALAFIENRENHKEINHINGNKTDNRVENLEWCTRKENMQHCWDNGYRDHLKINLSDKNRKGGIIGLSEDGVKSIYFRTSFCAKTFGYNPRNLRYWANKKLTRNGYKWGYVDETYGR